MSGLDNVTAAVKAAEARLDRVITTVEGLRTTVSTLQSQLASLPEQEASLVALANELSSHVTAFDSALNPESETNNAQQTSNSTADA